MIATIALRLGGGLVGGLLIGLLHFLFRWRLAHALLGIVGVAPWCMLAGNLYYGVQYGSFESVSGTVVITVLMGGPLGLLAGQEYSGQSAQEVSPIEE